MRLQAPHCPNCAAPVTVPEGAGSVRCAYCDATLVVQQARVAWRPPPAPPEEAEPPFAQPEADLFAVEGRRFELSVLEQRVPGPGSETFFHLELGQDRFALGALRLVDGEGRPTGEPADALLPGLRASLEEDGDPGLAANLALEALCRRPSAPGLEVALLLFEPEHMTCTAYRAGCPHALWWLSSEEGRAIDPGSGHEALTRRMLREARDHFANDRPLRLASGDLVVLASAGLLGRGERWGGNLRPLLDAFNAHLGEEPLRLVTLAKNAFWEERGRSKQLRAQPPAGDVRIAAVRAAPPPLCERLPGEARPLGFASRRYEVALYAGPHDSARLLPLHADRQVLVWLSPERPLAAEQVAAAERAVLAVLDRPDYGDNDNPRLAGREALAALGPAAAGCRLAVIQLFDAFERVKYFRAGWKQPLLLGERGVRGDGQQQFDEGGEATVRGGARLFFPGPLAYEGEFGAAEPFAAAWRGGKASRLYEALAAHWKARKAERALERLALAAASDAPLPSPAGLALVGSRA